MSLERWSGRSRDKRGRETGEIQKLNLECKPWFLRITITSSPLLQTTLTIKAQSKGDALFHGRAPFGGIVQGTADQGYDKIYKVSGAASTDCSVSMVAMLDDTSC